MFTVYHCDHCESQCSADCEQTPKYGSTVLWCVKSVATNSSKEESMRDQDGIIFDNSVSFEWIEPSPTLASLPYLSSQVNHQLCLCSLNTGVTQCNSSSEEGVYRCIIKGSDVTETLQFTYSVYKLITVPTSTSTTSAPGNNIITSSSSYQTMKVSTTTLLSTETTTTTTTVNNFSSVTSVSSSSLSSTTCPSSVKDQNSTLLHYGGIGLLATTNLLTFIVLVTSCVYIIHSKKQTKYALGRSRANVTVQSNPIGSLSVINIETEILNKDYDSCLHKQQQQQTQQQQQQQQQQQESSHPSIDIYSYTVDDEEDHSTADNDEYAVPDDLFEVKRKGSNPPPSVPPPYAWKGIAMVEESVNGVGNSSSVDNFDCLYATIGSKEEEKEQAS
ncbi:PREDICTED: cell wall integrity and stress response component 3-like [Amphimedon queenslandica]|uniref:Uncharacterized protein n=1 Tax=Amphimedon queenslandica TaxID=400682 RepID=A0AAN0JG61_AMPQE|nr:PREDICTED: cell wall integrity and stress response component 3-like [Amphimedon queenslandica]|eukprot:XP_019855777.1 PREDICTED: cell wall integrity and stress response component 3-like [Amphimedon queenslandica]